jgi:septal ring factor EnvC (AmiA/AmiB activator)
MWHNGWRLIGKRFHQMLPRHKKALSDIKSAEKKLRDARTKYRKTKDELAKAKKRVDEARTRLLAAQELYES